MTWQPGRGPVTPFYRSTRGEPRINVTPTMLSAMLDIVTGHVEREPPSKTYYRYEAEWDDGKPLPGVTVAALRRHGLMTDRRLRHGSTFRAMLTTRGEECLGDLTADPRTH